MMKINVHMKVEREQVTGSAESDTHERLPKDSQRLYSTPDF